METKKIKKQTSVAKPKSTKKNAETVKKTVETKMEKKSLKNTKTNSKVVATKKSASAKSDSIKKKTTTARKKAVKKNKKIALVLEGGGMRGAYTAGCLAWLIQNDIKFDGAYGISSGAVHLTSYLWQRKDWLFDMSTRIIPEKEGLGLSGFIKEGKICAFDFKFTKAKNELGYTITGLKTSTNAKFGLYDLNEGKVVYKNVAEMNDELLKAACSLPILAKTIEIDGHKYLDAGIHDMIPIHQSVADGYDGHLIITTKAKDYVRKKTNPLIVKLMSWVYKSCPNIAKDYAVRAENYYEQLQTINKLVDDGKAIYRYPTVNMTNITRLGGEPEDLAELFNLGFSDMEAIKEDIFKLCK